MSAGETAFVFSLGGVAVECEFGSGTADIVHSYANSTIAAPGLLERAGTLKVSVEEGAETSPAARGLPLTCAFGDASGFTGSGRLELWDGSSLVVAELDGHAVRAAIGSPSNRHLVGSVMLFTATALAIRAHGLFHLHAGCVDVPGHGSVLIVGESGSGKTTLSIALAALGGYMVSDDSVFLRESQKGGIEVAGWPADLHVAPATLAAFPELAAHGHRPVTDGHAKRAVPLSSLRRPWLPLVHDPKLVLFPVIGDAAVSRLRPLKRGEAVTQLIPQSAFALVPGASRVEEHLRLLAELAGGAPAFEITLGADVFAPGEGLLDVLGEGFRHAV